MRNKKKLKVIYKSLWDKATPEEKKEYEGRINNVYDMLFNKILKTDDKKTKK